MQFDIRRLDIYRKIPKDLTQPTKTGACISVGSVLFIAYLFISELTSYLSSEIVTEMYVDDPATNSERIPVKLDISLLNMECKYIGLDIQDDLGRHEVGFVDNTDKVPINNNEGCRFKSSFKINKVPGNFHISTHASKEQPPQPNMKHIVHELIFGDRVPQTIHIPGSFNPLLEKDKSESNALSSHDYYLKIVPAVFNDYSGKTLMHPYQYTFAYRHSIRQRGGQVVIPAIWFKYKLNPMCVKYSEQRPIPFYHFLTAVCAIVGGTFTVAGIFDSFLFTAAEIFKKAELGKLS
ncbi:hypothetical protein CAPTEDRAFT_224400 [Capitella teleta]|uniref:Endoplasmic reticulum vesicle transporter C-terminal domain-containing protein n=1 Tax=Capitella teleta TaxID=283909 RepID=R7T4T2_CAPTE|nr:hypothetical protein CAPTEDRAFT_224400 [Capitella teleta]|eukprot:ELT87978.1 hypothetical protein CAPTEDRAFT_224400 [Capitella teleta]